MFNYTNKTKINFYLIVIFIIIWTILTELLFKGSQVFPSPSLIIISFIDLFTSYNFLINLISSISVIYISIILTIAIIRIKFPLLNYNSTIIKYLMQIPVIFLNRSWNNDWSTFNLLVWGQLFNQIVLYCIL